MAYPVLGQIVFTYVLIVGAGKIYDTFKTYLIGEAFLKPSKCFIVRVDGWMDGWTGIKNVFLHFKILY